ncbi:helix-turn-helix domain-containing protein [Rhabdothermincola sediminis]|uniref:helix-turn-helix domain-containing protein n=1 Tax=Rhabdothermincola sediminis TaxID=2751370 RepID=UPI001AA08BAC|nr:helix-turn-helix domain-containing protein [Rhabdothermincola sediminis]
MNDLLTIEEAAELLNVRPSFVSELIEGGTLRQHGAGAGAAGVDPCLDTAEVLAFRERSDAAASAALDEMTAEGEAADLYDE